MPGWKIYRGRVGNLFVPANRTTHVFAVVCSVCYTHQPTHQQTHCCSNDRANKQSHQQTHQCSQCHTQFNPYHHSKQSANKHSVHIHTKTK